MNQKRDNNQQIGLTSVAGMLKMIYDETLTTNVLLGDIHSSVSGLKPSSMSFANFGTSNSIISNDYQNKHLSIITSISNVLTEIRDYFFDKDKKDQAASSTERTIESTGRAISNIVNNNDTRDFFLSYSELLNGMLTSIQIALQKISTHLERIYNYLPIIASGNVGSSDQAKVKQKETDFQYFGETIIKIAKALDDKFVTRFFKFVKIYQEFIEDKNTKKMVATAVQLNHFGFAVRTAAFWIGQARDMFMGLVTSILMVSLIIISPIFMLGIGILIGAIHLLQKSFGSDRADPNSPMNLLIMRSEKFTFALIQLGAALWLVSKVPFGAVIKFAAVLGLLIGLVKLMHNKNGGNEVAADAKEANSFFTLADALKILVVALASTVTINWKTAGFLIAFIFSIGMTIRMFSNGKGRAKDEIGTMIMKVAGGLALLALTIDAITELNWTSALYIITFILSVGLAVGIANKMMGNKSVNIRSNKSSNTRMSGLFGFAAGLAILVLTIAAVEELNTASALWLIGFIIAVGFAVALPSLFGSKRGGQMSGIFGFAAGIALLVLVVAATDELNWSPAWKLLGFMLAVTGIIALFQKIADTNQLVKQGFGLGAFIGIFALTIWGTSKLMEGVQHEQMTKFGIYTLSFVLLVGFLNTVKTKIVSGIAVFKVLTIGMVLASAAFYIISQSGTNWETLLQFGAMVVGMAVVTTILGVLNSTGMILLGAAAVAIMSTGLLLAAGGFFIISKSQLNYEQLKQFGILLGGLSVLTAGMALIAPFIIAGSAALVVLGAGTLLTATALYLVSILTFDTKNISDFSIGVKTLCETYAALGWKVATAVLVAVGMIIVIGVTFSVAAALTVVNLIKHEPAKIQKFSDSIGILVGAYDDIGLVKLGKTVLKAAMMVPILASSILAAVAFKKIGELNVDRSTMSNFGNVMTEFLSVSTEAINQSLPALKEIEPGMAAFAQMVTATSGLVDVVQAFADMKYGVWEYDKQTGKMKLVGYKPITGEMLGQVGTGIGKLLKALIEPLAIVSSDEKQWRLGSTIVDNPFVRGNKISQFFLGDKQSGSNRIKMIGDAYSSLTGVIGNVAGLELLSDKTRFETFKNNFGTFIGSLVASVKHFEPIDNVKLKKNSESLIWFSGALKRFMELESINTKNNIGDVVKRMMDSLSDDKRWNNINKYLKTAATNVKEITTNINKIDIQKATALERNLRLFSEANTLDGIKEAIAHLQELIGMLQEQEDRNERIAQQSAERLKMIAENTNPLQALVQNPLQPNSTQTPGKPNLIQPTNNQKKKEEDKLEELVTMLNQALAGINSKLGGTLKVKVVDANNTNLIQ